MQDSKVIPLNERYRYNLFVNNKAIQDFIVMNNTESLITRLTQIHVLSFLVAMSTSKGIISITDENGAKYIYATDNFILNNLKFLGVKSRQLKNILKQLELAKTIERKTVDNNQRYVRVHPELMNKWNGDNWAMTASGYMVKHRPPLWKSIVNEWMPILGTETFKEVVDWCNSEIDLQQIKYNDYDATYKLFTNTMKKWSSKLSKTR